MGTTIFCDACKITKKENIAGWVRLKGMLYETNGPFPEVFLQGQRSLCPNCSRLIAGLIENIAKRCVREGDE